MTNNAIIWMALDLLHSPTGVKHVRAAPLPQDVNILLRIAAGDEDASRQMAEATSQPQNAIREAAEFYIEQILLHPDADYYRVLGTRPNASTTELRRNMALLMRWLHPDQHNGRDRSVFAARVTRAWGELKTEERRAAYDLSRRRALSNKSKVRMERGKQEHSRSRARYRSRQRILSQSHHYPGILMRVFFMLFGRALH
jgi:hypothetical protein